MSGFKSLSVKTKLLATYFAVSAMLGSVAGYGLYQLGVTNAKVADIYLVNLEPLVALANVQTTLTDARRSLANVFALKGEKEFQEAGETFQVLKTAYEKDYLVTVVAQATTPEEQKMVDEIKQKIPTYFELFEKTLSQVASAKEEEAKDSWAASRAVGNALDVVFEKEILLNKELAATAMSDSNQAYTSTVWLTVGLITGFTLLSLFIGWYMARWFTGAVLDVARIADEVAIASRQLAGAAEELSSGAQEQASSLEETASSLEEITSTIQQNSDNAQQANQLAGTSRKVAENGGEAVTKAVQGMSEINSASKRIADIITTIDEIAFQTNLLALNAAVEAARAGEQGRGFAVVAGEVRNLAQRSSGAAKEIKSLIQDSVSKVESGSELVNDSGRTLAEILSSVKRVGDIVTEIAAASREQASGIEQVNQAVTQMDQVVQTNAAQTEELSATAEQLSGKALELQAVVSQFNLVQGTSLHSARQVSSSSASRDRAPKAKSKRPSAPRKIAATSHSSELDTVEREVERELELLTTTSSSNGFESF